MKITISGNLGSGKSTVAKQISKILGIKHYSAGDFMRSMANERGISLLELSEIAEENNLIDKEIDERTKKLANSDESFILDSRLAFHFIPNSFKIFLGCSEDVAAKRTFDAKRKDETYNCTVEQTKENMKTREQSEEKRYKQIYNVSYFDKSKYDYVLDTSKISIGEEVQLVLSAIKKHFEQKKKINE